MNKKKIGIILAIITISSKIAALLLTFIFSRVFGVSEMTDAYYAASSIPNLINNSLCVCSLTLFIPTYISCKNDTGEKNANKFASNILNSYTLFNFILTLVVISCAGLLVNIVAPGFDIELKNKTKYLIMLLSLSYPITIATQVLINISNANGKHIIQSLLTLVNHIITIILLLIVAPKYGMYSFPIICVVAWIIQFAIQYLFTKEFFSHSFIIDLKNNYLKKMLLLSIPVIIATSSEQINLAIDNIICSTLPFGTVSYLGYAQKIYIAILGTFTGVLMTIYYPMLSRKYNERNFKGLIDDIRNYVNIMIIVLIPISLFLLFNGDYLIKILYGGSLSLESVDTVSNIFKIYAIALVIISFRELLNRLFYIKNNTKTPMLVNIISLVVNTILSIILSKRYGVYGIAVATVVAMLFSTIIEFLFLLKTTKIMTFSKIKKMKIYDYKLFCKILIATIIALVSSLIMRNNIYINNSIIMFLMVGALYCVVYGLLSLAICKKDIYKSILKK